MTPISKSKINPSVITLQSKVQGAKKKAKHQAKKTLHWAQEKKGYTKDTVTLSKPSKISKKKEKPLPLLPAGLSLNDHPNPREFAEALDLVFFIESTEHQEENLRRNPQYLANGEAALYKYYFPLLDQKKTYVAILSDEFGVAGVAMLTAPLGSHTNNGSYRFAYVREDWRNKGLLDWMTPTIEAKGRELGFNKLAVYDWERNHRIIRHLQEQGFTTNPSGQDELVYMEKSLR